MQFLLLSSYFSNFSFVLILILYFLSHRMTQFDKKMNCFRFFVWIYFSILCFSSFVQHYFSFMTWCNLPSLFSLQLCQMLLNQSNQVGKARADFAFRRKRPIGSLSEKSDATGSFFYTVNRIKPAAVNSVSGTKCWRDSARSTPLLSKWVNTKACSRCSDLLYLGRTECSVQDTLKFLPRICHLG